MKICTILIIIIFLKQVDIVMLPDVPEIFHTFPGIKDKCGNSDLMMATTTSFVALSESSYM
jgi:uncharacterized membrane protein